MHTSTGGTTLTVSGLGFRLAARGNWHRCAEGVPLNCRNAGHHQILSGTTDTSILESKYKFGGNTSGNDDAYF
ncbi:MAG: hypothetical protein IPP15_23395 [Saprospiraceae bacterium]|uniref:Uncharacterized protein n=1 Tax=Candidatus Opimibacter skivensis TaxID=2982028 RepID=A0A9D7T084_9BACT|nr:hypothetical protein [Candidatus Opimibacter skivensis]